VTWDSDPRVESREKEGVLSTPQFRAGAKVLGRMGLSLDTICCFPQLPEMVAFARAVPEVTIIMNHLGGLNRTGPFAGRDEVMPAWRAGMAELAKCPNVYLKLGGHGMPRFGFDWHTREKPIASEELARDMAPLLTSCIEQFGPERCMFESNFPVGKVSFSYPVLFNALKRFSRPCSAAERAALFHDTAVRVYRIGEQ
jgi:predicted TIM-barrel fold metal-dependent hydrolase